MSKLVSFMKWKSRFLPKNKRDKYFNLKDEKFLKDLDPFLEDMILSNITLELIQLVNTSSSIKELPIWGSITCPFCYIAELVCEKCFYAKNHRKCSNTHSDYRNIKKHMKFVNKEVVLKKVLSLSLQLSINYYDQAIGE